MFLTVHATAGVLIARQISNPLLAFFLGLISHYALDTIPHGDDAFFERWSGKTKLKMIAIAAIIDIVISSIWLTTLFQFNLVGAIIPTLAAVIGAVLPDFLSGAYQVTKNKFLAWNYRLNDGAHRVIVKKPLPEWLGFFIQFMFILALLRLVFV